MLRLPGHASAKLTQIGLLPGERVSQVYAGNQASIAVVFIEEEMKKKKNSNEDKRIF